MAANVKKLAKAVNILYDVKKIGESIDINKATLPPHNTTRGT